ncbi:2,5-dihydroxypyridine 5,6-dioxygenase [Microbacteriaceae bacterium K1510]|nr:2,5-dihydroxypyridine 5,6-dioxygenase [Microbacteriaceae bacterium K1510]
MAISDSDLIAAWTQVLKLSRLKSTEFVTILTDQDSHPQTVSCARTAAQLLGAKVICLDLSPMNGDKSLSRDKTAYVGHTPLTGNTAAMAALKASHLVIDLMLLLFSPEQQEILEGGTRILLAVEPPEVLVRMLPTEADKARVTAAAAVLKKSRSMHVQSDAGTDFRCALGAYPVLTEYGFSEEPGRWDHWPSGFLATWPNETTSEGTIVLDRGDILLPMKRYLAEPVKMTIRKGYVTDIAGALDADLLRDYMESFNDPEAYAISHIGWGLQPRARWSTMGLFDPEATLGMDARAFEGNFLFSLGPNTEAGGTRNTACHIDIPMRNCTVLLDNKPVVDRGRVLEAA